MEFASAEAIGKLTQEGGIIFNDEENNKAMAQYSQAIGTKTRAGGKGYKIKNVTIVSPDSGPVQTAKITVEDGARDITNNYAKGDLICFDGEGHWYNQLNITDLILNGDGTSTISVEALPNVNILRDQFKPAEKGLGEDENVFNSIENWVWVVNKYDAGVKARYSQGAFAGGEGAIAMGRSAYSIGRDTKAIGNYSHAEGRQTTAIGYGAHAEGAYTDALSYYSHTEGYYTKATNQQAHAEGRQTQAKGQASHAEGDNTIATRMGSHVEGAYNVEDKEEKFIHITGNGTGPATNQRSNAFAIDNNGNGYFKRDIFVNCENDSSTNGSKGIAESLDNKVDKVEGKGLSTNDYTTAEQNKLKNTVGQEYVYNTTDKDGKPVKYIGEIFNNYANNRAQGSNSHAEGNSTQALNANSHAEGNQTTANGNQSHAEGELTLTTGTQAHAEGRKTRAHGQASHAEGFSDKNYTDDITNTTINDIKTSWTSSPFSLTYGIGSHVEGKNNLALGDASHAEGFRNIAHANYSHAEGQSCRAEGQASHAEGFEAQAKGEYSHAEGYKTAASGKHSHAEGSSTIANGPFSHAEGSQTQATNYYSHAEGYLSRATGQQAHAEGRVTIASGQAAHSEGSITVADVMGAHAEGGYTIASGQYSHAEGYGNSYAITLQYSEPGSSGQSWYKATFNPDLITTQDYIYYDGTKTLVKIAGIARLNDEEVLVGLGGDLPDSEAFNATLIKPSAQGTYSHAEGYKTSAQGTYSHAEGVGTIAYLSSQHVEGEYNLHPQQDIYEDHEWYLHITGNGQSDSKRANAYTLDALGNGVYAGSVQFTTAADYAEYFEWEDGNPNNEDRVGYVVALNGDKIRKATAEDIDILGIISGTAAVIGDTAEWNWSKKFLTDEFGRIITEKVEQFHQEPIYEVQITKHEELDPKTGEIVTVQTEEEVQVGTKKISDGFRNIPITNPEYNATQPYTSRAKRPEWGCVGMLGKLYVRDDGTCQVNGYAKVGVDGELTASDAKTNMRVLSRVNDHVIRVLLK